MAATVDSNVILRLLLRDNPGHEAQARAWLHRQSPGTVLVLDPVLVEVLFQLEANSGYGISRKSFLPKLFLLLSAPQLYSEPLTRRALGIFADTKLDYVDCLLAALRRGGKLDEVFTFDRRLKQELSTP